MDYCSAAATVFKQAPMISHVDPNRMYDREGWFQLRNAEMGLAPETLGFTPSR
jgi:hypothetical protein